MSGRIPPATVEALIERAAGFCDACGGPLVDNGWDRPVIHHRKLRKHGGGNELVNLMYVHGGGTGGCHNLHQGSIHQNSERSYRLGHLVRAREDPADIPVIVVRDLRDLRA